VAAAAATAAAAAAAVAIAGAGVHLVRFKLIAKREVWIPAPVEALEALVAVNYLRLFRLDVEDPELTTRAYSLAIGYNPR